MDLIDFLLKLFSFLLTICNLTVILYTFKKFLGKPKDDIISRVVVLEEQIKLLKEEQKEKNRVFEERLMRGNDRFRDQDTSIQVLTHTSLALLEFEIQYCIESNKPVSQGLEDAKRKLNDYLAQR